MASSLLSAFGIDDILSWSTLRFAEETESWQSVERLLDGGASIRDLVATKRKLEDPCRAPYVISELCRHSHLRLLKFALSLDQSVVDTLFPQGRTLLHVAAQSGCSVAIRCLIDANANVNTSDERGVTPLHEAAAHCDYYSLLLLLRSGANANARDVDGRTALHYAARGGSAPGIQVLLSEGLSPDVVSANGCTPLHEAAASPNPQCVYLLLNAGADKDVKTLAGWTALHWAASKGVDRTVRILLDAGLTLDCRTEDQETPLHFAAEREAGDMVAILVEAGANPEAVDKEGRTPGERALERKCKDEAAALSASTTCSDRVLLTESGQPPPADESRRVTESLGLNDSPGEVRHSAASIEDCTTTIPGQSATLQLKLSSKDFEQTVAEGMSAVDQILGSEHSFLSDSEEGADIYIETSSEPDDDDASVSTASETQSCYGGPSLISAVDTGTPQSSYQRRGRGRHRVHKKRGCGDSRAQQTETRNNVHGQSQERGHHWHRPKQFQDHQRGGGGGGHFSGNAQQNVHHGPKNFKKFGTFDGRGRPHIPKGEGGYRTPQHFNRGWQMHSSDQRQQYSNPTARPQQSEAVTAFPERVQHQQSSSGGTFMDDLRILRETVNVIAQTQNTAPKPHHPPQSRRNF